MRVRPVDRVVVGEFPCVCRASCDVPVTCELCELTYCELCVALAAAGAVAAAAIAASSV